MDGQVNWHTKMREFWWLVPLVLVSLVYLFRSSFFSLHDFTNYYFGSKLWLAGEFTNESYLPCYFNDQIKALGYNGYFGNYNPNPPFLLILMAPFTFLEAQTSKLVFNLFSISLFSYSIVQLIKRFNITKWYIFIFPLIFLVPLKNAILFGQLYLVLASLMILVLISYDSGDKFKATLFLALSVSIKLFPILICLLFLIKKDWKSILYTVFFLVVGVLVLLVFTGIELPLFYLFEILPSSFNGLISEEFVLAYQSINTWVYSLFTTHSIYNPHPLFGKWSSFAPFFTALISATIVGGLTSYVQHESIKKSSGLILLCCVVLTPYGSTYSVLVSGVGFSLVYSHLNKKTQWICIGLFVMASVKPQQLEFSVLLPRLWSLLVILFICFKQANLRSTWLSFALAIIVFGLKLNVAPKSNVDYAINPKSLVCDFNQVGDSVHVKGINHSGIQQWSEKLLPGKGVLKLSSENRGLGFTTLVYSKVD